MTETIKKLDLGRVITRAFRVLFADGAKVLTLVLLVYSPQIVAALGLVIFGVESMTAAEAMTAWLGLGLSLSGLVFAPMATATATHAVFQSLRGEDISVAESLRTGAARLLPVLAVSLLSGVAIFAGTLACLLPGMIIASILFVIAPIAVVERVGIGEAFTRSAALTRGNRLLCFGLLLAIGLFNIAMPLLVNLLAGASFEPLTAFKVARSVSILLAVLVAAVQASIVCIVYHDLRVAKEGLDTEQLAAVFA